MIAGVSRRLTDAEGIAPKGWLGPWISESAHTPDLLHEGGYTYFLDWCHDDQPVWMRTRGGHILSVPYPQEVNDIPAILVRRTSAETFADMIIDNFDEMTGPVNETAAGNGYRVTQLYCRATVSS